MDLQALLYSLMNTRQIGKTRYAVKLAKESGAILLCKDRLTALSLKSEGLSTESIQRLDNLRGNTSPVVVDQDAIIEIIRLVSPEKRELLAMIDELVKLNFAMALTSPTEFIRKRAEELNDNT